MGNDFKEISVAIQARDSPVTFEELYDKLQDQETLLKQDEAKKETHLSLLIFTKDISSTIKGAMEATKILRYILEVILTIRSQPLILVTLVLSS